MQVCQVIGTVVSTKKVESLVGLKLLVVQPMDIRTGATEPIGTPVVAVDAVGAGEGEVVIAVAGSSSRLTKVTKDLPVDGTIVGIIDSIEVEGERVFAKYGE